MSNLQNGNAANTQGTASADAPKNASVKVKQILKNIRKDAENEAIIQLLLSEDVHEISGEGERRSFSEKAADVVATFVGSWAFILSFCGLLIGWFILNAVILVQNAFDPYPFILLNLVLSCIAAIQAPLIMMSQNRQSDIDRARAASDYKTNLKTEMVIEALYYKLRRMEKSQKEINKKINLLLDADPSRAGAKAKAKVKINRLAASKDGANQRDFD